MNMRVELQCSVRQHRRTVESIKEVASDELRELGSELQAGETSSRQDRRSTASDIACSAYSMLRLSSGVSSVSRQLTACSQVITVTELRRRHRVALAEECEEMPGVGETALACDESDRFVGRYQ